MLFMGQTSTAAISAASRCSTCPVRLRAAVHFHAAFPLGSSNSAPSCLQGLPSWQVLLVDLRCHGESAQLEQQPAPPHSVESSAKDTLTLLSRLKIFPEALVGHSFGGKVVLRWVLELCLHVRHTNQLQNGVDASKGSAFPLLQPLQCTAQLSCSSKSISMLAWESTSKLEWGLILMSTSAELSSPAARTA